MSYQPLWLRDLAAYSIQVAALIGVAAILVKGLRLRAPRIRLAYWQALLAVCLFLPMLQPWRPDVSKTIGSVASSVHLLTSAGPVGSTSLTLAEIVLLLICAGILARAGWIALGLVRMWDYHRQAQRIEEAPQAVLEAQQLVPLSPALYISDGLKTPATFGFLRPVILFPAGFLEMEPPIQKAVALHELLHVERRDWLWNLLEEVILTLLWFQIPLWAVIQSIRLSREQVVDHEAVLRSRARWPYLKALLQIADQKLLAESLPAPLFLRESQLVERVALMMKEVHMSRGRLTVSILTAAGVLLVAGASVIWAFPLKITTKLATPNETPSAAAKAENSVAASAPFAGNSNAVAGVPDYMNTKVYKVGGKVKAPTPIYKPEPPYTKEARNKHLKGTVVFWIVVDSKGSVISIKEASKHLGEGLDESAMTTIRTWKFEPATRDGVPVAVRVMVEVSFKFF